VAGAGEVCNARRTLRAAKREVGNPPRPRTQRNELVNHGTFEIFSISTQPPDGVESCQQSRSGILPLCLISATLFADFNRLSPSFRKDAEG
jgi:hypothetical protein